MCYKTLMKNHYREQLCCATCLHSYIADDHTNMKVCGMTNCEQISLAGVCCRYEKSEWSKRTGKTKWE